MADLHQDINTVSSLHLAGGASIEQDEVNDQVHFRTLKYTSIRFENQILVVQYLVVHRKTQTTQKRPSFSSQLTKYKRQLLQRFLSYIQKSFADVIRIRYYFFSQNVVIRLYVYYLEISLYEIWIVMKFKSANLIFVGYSTNIFFSYLCIDVSTIFTPNSKVTHQGPRNQMLEIILF